MIKSVKFVSVPTRDQDKALKFWTEQVGFAVATDQPFDEDQRWIELRIPRADTALVLFTPPGHEGRIGAFTNIAFLADDVEATYRQLEGRGVEFVQAPTSQDWGTSAVFKDPDGNAFVISSR